MVRDITSKTKERPPLSQQMLAAGKAVLVLSPCCTREMPHPDSLGHDVGGVDGVGIAIHLASPDPYISIDY